MNMEKDERSISKPDTSQSTQNLKDSFPLLGYATLYTFFHLNRSGPDNSFTLASMETVLKSTQSLVWIQHFAHLLFEDITLESQMSEFMAWGDRMAVAGLDEKFSAVFEETLEKWKGQTRKVGKDADPLASSLLEIFDESEDESSTSLSRKQSIEATDLDLDFNTAEPKNQTVFSNQRRSQKVPSATMSRAIDLLKGQTSLTIPHQVELWLRLSTSLHKTNVMIDPLKVLFRLILRKASGIHVYVLLVIGGFYRKLERFQEAVEVYSVASKKVNHLDVPLKYKLHVRMGDCYRELGLDTEALRFYESAFSGQEIHLGRRHSDTLDTLSWMICINSWMCRYTEVLRLSDKICMEQEFVPEMSLRRNLDLHARRHTAYRHVGNHERAVHVEESIRATLKLCHEADSNNDNISPVFNREIGTAYSRLDEHDTALKFFQLAFEEYKDSKCSSNFRRMLYIQYRIALTYANLGRYCEAKDLLETVLAKQQSLLGSHHREVQWTKDYLDYLKSDHDELT